MEKLVTIANLLEASLIKEAGKERVGRSKVNKMLDKAKTEYGKLKSQLDSLESQHDKLKTQLEEIRHLTNSARQKVIKFHRAMQAMDLANASDAVFYHDDSSDIGYIINGKEYHLDINELGEMTLHPMRQFRSERKSKKEQEKADDCLDLESEDSELEIKDEDLDDLYNSLVQ